MNELEMRHFIVDSIVDGVKDGTFSRAYGNILAVNYFAKGLLTMDDVESVKAQTTEEITQEVIEEEVEEVVTDEIETGTEDTETEEEVEEVPAE